MGVWVPGCAGVRVCECVMVYFIEKNIKKTVRIFCLLLYQENAPQHNLHLSLHTTSTDICSSGLEHDLIPTISHTVVA